MFQSLIPYIAERLAKHHEIYSAQCKAEYWEEILSYALKQSGFGSDWKPDFNHKSGVDQTTDSGIRISNKGGSIVGNSVKISGSRLTKHKTITEKLEFLSEKKEDYIFCLACRKCDWEMGDRIYYFIVIDADKLNYHEQEWKETMGSRENTKGSVVGWECTSEEFSAKIKKSMSDQLWTTIKLESCQEVHDITIG